jgi:hypothetical protein
MTGTTSSELDSAMPKAPPKAAAQRRLSPADVLLLGAEGQRVVADQDRSRSVG